MKVITEQDLVARVSQIVSREAGIVLGPKQVVQVQAKLSQRMRKLQIASHQEYAAYLEANLKTETEFLVSLLTTHHTFFFRESHHFDFIAQQGLARAVEAAKAQGRRKIRVWSAASSSGQEAYTLSMLLSVHMQQIAPGFGYEIIGTDIDPESVAIANNGVYRWEDLKSVPNLYLQNHWSRGTGEIADFVKAKASLKQPCQFRVDNLIDLKMPSSEKFDFIFCRNVFIYFTPEQVRIITENLIKHLEPHGYLMIGHSESLTSMQLPLTFLGQSIYAAGSAPAKGKTASATKHAPQSVPQLQVVPSAGPLKVVCVDDSPTVLTLLKKILSKEKGFDVVGTAASGVEAEELMRKTQADVMTLDIHMPQKNGLEYLRSNMKATHPPVVMVTSVSREDADLAFQCLSAGAFEYVEKPSLKDMDKVGQEIRAKVRSAYEAKKQKSSVNLTLDGQFKATAAALTGVEKKMRVLVTPYGSLQKTLDIVKQLRGSQPGILLLLDHPGPLFEKLSDQIKRSLPLAQPLNSQTKDLAAGRIYFGDMDEHRALLGPLLSGKQTVCSVIGPVSSANEDAISRLSQVDLILEDGVAYSASLKARAKQVIPVTSLVYEADKLFSQPVKGQHDIAKTRVS